MCVLCTPQVMKNALEPLNCVGGSDGRPVMQADPSIVCDPMVDPQYRWGGVLVGMGMCVYVCCTCVWVSLCCLCMDVRGAAWKERGCDGMRCTLCSLPLLFVRINSH